MYNIYIHHHTHHPCPTRLSSDLAYVKLILRNAPVSDILPRHVSKSRHVVERSKIDLYIMRRRRSAVVPLSVPVGGVIPIERVCSRRVLSHQLHTETLSGKIGRAHV